MRLKTYLTEASKPYYHGTFSSNLPSIKRHGLTFKQPNPEHGYKDTTDKIFIADDYNEAFYYISIFASQRGHPPISILTVKPNSEVYKGYARNEYYVTEPIPPKNIKADGWNPNTSYIDITRLKGADRKVAEKYYSV